MSKILIIGDSNIDKFQYGKITRLSPEAPVPVFNPTYKVENSGMAGNLYENVKILNLGRTNILTNKIKPLKTRFVDEFSNQQIMRLDENDNTEKISDVKLYINNIWDAIIISDYNKGYLTENDIGEIGNLAKKNNIITFLDTKKKLNWDNMDFLKDIDFIKINEPELKQNELALSKGAWYNGDLIVTLGANGAHHYNKNSKKVDHYPIEKKAEVRDLSGAGDTFLAGLVVNYLESKDIASAIKFANKCASYVVTQKGVVVVDINKIV